MPAVAALSTPLYYLFVVMDSSIVGSLPNAGPNHNSLGRGPVQKLAVWVQLTEGETTLALTV